MNTLSIQYQNKCTTCLTKLFNNSSNMLELLKIVKKKEYYKLSAKHTCQKFFFFFHEITYFISLAKQQQQYSEDYNILIRSFYHLIVRLEYGFVEMRRNLLHDFRCKQ